jgi:hypothetical protein
VARRYSYRARKRRGHGCRKRAERRQARRVRTKCGSRGTGFCDASVLHGRTDCLTIDRRTLTCFPAKSTSCHFKPNSSLMRRPVPAAKRTRVFSLLRKLRASRLISEGKRTSGAVRRFALWRTRLMGLRSIKSWRLAWLKSTLIKFRILARLALASGSVRSHNSTSTALTELRLVVPHLGTIPFRK